jgi:hypothetical protein
MFDVFYSGTKPNLFAHEQPALDIAHARSQSRTRYFWWTNYLTDYSGFDFLFEPVPWQAEYTHAWPSQWQRDSGTYLIPVKGSQHVHYHNNTQLTRRATTDNWIVSNSFDINTFDFSWHPDPSEPEYTYQFGTQHQRTGGPQYFKNKDSNAGIKFVDQIRGSARPDTIPIVEIDHIDNNAGQITNTVRTVRYFDNYLDTLTRIANTTDSEYVWICSSICDYTDFDFSWHPDQWQATMLHVFASDNTKFGDTFYMHVPSFRARIAQFKLLDWYDINFVGVTVPRRTLPVIKHNCDCQIEAIKNNSWAGPLAIFTTQDNNIIIDNIPAVSLWKENTKTIVPLSSGAGTTIIPKTAIPYIKKQIYDYPYIDRTQRHMYTDNLLDIVFIDNGEPNADDNYQYLKWAAERANNIRIHRSTGINGRVAAYQAAAELSRTPWFFAVFAKLEVSSTFDWTWQPDRLQEPKHYIFHAFNPVNGLEYGHQAMIAYNKRLVLENTAPGLDFTLDQAHEVVPIVSGIANYHYSKWVAWRTAFRECIKLKHSLPDVENEYRLARWLTPVNNIENSEYSVWGAEDAVEYYNSVAGDFGELRKSYDWAWLASYALIKRNLTPNQ